MNYILRTRKLKLCFRSVIYMPKIFIKFLFKNIGPSLEMYGMNKSAENLYIHLCLFLAYYVPVYLPKYFTHDHTQVLNWPFIYS